MDPLPSPQKKFQNPPPSMTEGESVTRLRDHCSPKSSSLISLAACSPSSRRFLSICRLRARAARSSADIAQPIFRPTFARAEIFTRAAIIRARRKLVGRTTRRRGSTRTDRQPLTAPVLCRSSGPSSAAVRAAVVAIHVPRMLDAADLPVLLIFV